MKIFNCNFLGHTVALVAVLFLGGMALTLFPGVPTGETSLAMMLLSYVGFLMILASPVLLFLVAIVAFFPGAQDRSSPC